MSRAICLRNSNVFRSRYQCVDHELAIDSYYSIIKEFIVALQVPPEASDPMTSFFKSASFQKPLANLRSVISNIWRRIFALTGRYRPLSNDDIQIQKTEAVTFAGDIPLRAGDRHAQSRLVYTNRRPVFDEISNLVVTPSGHGWIDGVLFEKYSATVPGLRALASKPEPCETIPYGYFVQAEHIDTFGDWMSEYLAPISNLPNLDGPILLPQTLANRHYVERDCKRLGLNVRFIKQTIKIERARVIRQQRVIRYWSAQEADSLRRFLDAPTVTPKPGSIIYLSRHGEASEVAVRTHPHDRLEAAVQKHGGRILRTRDTTLDEYLAAAENAETVIMDHGSAGYNMAYWQPKRVVEIVSDAWWMNAFLFFANAIGVRDYVIIRSDQGSPSDAAQKIDNILKQPIHDLK